MSVEFYRKTGPTMSIWGTDFYKQQYLPSHCFPASLPSQLYFLIYMAPNRSQCPQLLAEGWFLKGRRDQGSWLEAIAPEYHHHATEGPQVPPPCRGRAPSATTTPRKCPAGENFPSSMTGHRMLQDTTDPQMLTATSWQLCHPASRSKGSFSMLPTTHQGFHRT